LNIKGVSKKVILEGLGFKVDRSGMLTLNGNIVKALDQNVSVRADDVKAVMPGSLKVITDISELETLEDIR
jgi:hypothetical protein